MNFIYPKHTEFYKFLLIEELYYVKHPALIHYGKCSIIGYLSSADTIQSLKIPKIKGVYQLPDGSLSLKIYTEFHPKEFLHRTVQIYGEVKLIEKNHRKVNLQKLESAHSLMHKLGELQRCLELKEGLDRKPSGTNDKSMKLPIKVRLGKEIIAFEQKYMPIIYVDNIRALSMAREIIYENLCHRRIKQKIKRHKLRPKSKKKNFSKIRKK